MKIDTEDNRLLKSERQFLRRVAIRLKGLEPRPPIDAGHEQAIAECFGADPRARDVQHFKVDRGDL